MKNPSVHIIPELQCQKKCANLNFVYPHSTRLYDRLFLFEEVKNAPHPTEPPQIVQTAQKEPPVREY